MTKPVQERTPPLVKYSNGKALALVHHIISTELGFLAYAHPVRREHGYTQIGARFLALITLSVYGGTYGHIQHHIRLTGYTAKCQPALTVLLALSAYGFWATKHSDSS